MIRLFIVLLATAVSLSATTINVPGDQATIQAGIDAAVDGDTVLVSAGTYVENVVVNKILTIKAVFGNSVVISGSGATAISIENASTGRISGLTVTNSEFGINIVDCSDFIIDNCTLYENTYGVNSHLWGEIQISNSLFYNNTYGFHNGYYGNDCTIVNCTFDNVTDILFQPANSTTTKLDIYNSILFGQISGGDTNPVNLYYSRYTEGTLGLNSHTVYENITSDPQLVDASNANYSLGSSSPCIDAGDPMGLQKDPDNTRNDMGYTGGRGILCSQTIIDFGYVALSGSHAKSFSITNLTTSAFTVSSSVTSDMDYELISSLPLQIIQGQKEIFNVQYEPSLTGEHAASLSIEFSGIESVSAANFTLKGFSIFYVDGVVRVPEDAPTIQSAVDVASANDTILINDGTYIENIKVNKTLSFRSVNGPESTIIAGDGMTGLQVLDGAPGSIKGIQFSGFDFGVSTYSSTIYTIDNCNFTNNTYGVNSHLWGEIQISNSLFYNNTYGFHNGYYGDDCTIVNCTFDNATDILFQPAYGTTAKLDIYNSILLGQIDGSTTNPVNLFYCDYVDGNLGVNVTAVSGNIAQDPFFVDPINGDYNLQPGSPCIDAGDPSSQRDEDGSRADMGAMPSNLGSSFSITINVPADYSTIQAAIDNSIEHDTVLVQPGTYVENLNFNGKNIVVGSLFLTTQDTSYISQTVIDGNQNGSVVVIGSGETVASMLCGFVLQNGLNQNGGAIQVINSHTTLDHLVITNCTANNSAGGIYLYNSESVVSNSTISNTIGAHSGGLLGWGGSPTLINLLISNNQGGIAGGIKADGCNMTIMHSTIVNNMNSGIWAGNTSTVNIENSILFNNGAAPNDQIINGGSTRNVSYSLVEGGYTGVGNLGSDPLFIDALNNNFHIQDYSPGIGSGTTTDAPIADIEGNPRPNPTGSNPDMGAYENELATPVHNSLINVSTTGTDDGSVGLESATFATIQAAIDYSVSGDTIIVSAGTYTGNYQIGAKSISLKSISGPDSTILQPLSDAVAIMDIWWTNDQESEINGFTFTGGNHNRGSALKIDNASPTIRNCIIKNNNGWEGVIAHTASSAILENCLIINNSLPYGVLRFFSDAGTQYINCTIAGNSVSTTLFDNNAITKPLFLNTIIHGNVGSINGIYSFRNSLVENGLSYAGVVLDTLPMFADSENGDYRLQDFSPCIGAGLDTTVVPANDVTGNPRPNPTGSFPDMGAYENPFGSPQHTPITINVPDDYATIQAGLNAADSTDTVLVQPGTYYENIIWPETNGIALISAGDTSNTIIDGGGSGSVITLNGSALSIDSTTTIRGFKITNGSSPFYGGGIAIDSVNNPIFEDLLVENNTAWYGGGISCKNGEPQFSRLVVRNNSSTEGGGLYFYNYASGNLSFTEISNNNAHKGGGVFCSENSNTIFNDTYLHHNTAVVGGGGVASYQNSNIEIFNSKFEENVCQSDHYGYGHGGGGLLTDRSNPLIDNTLFLKNYCVGHGGGMKNFPQSSPTITNSTFIENHAGIIGGAVSISNSGVPSIRNNKFIGNVSPLGGALVLGAVGDGFYERNVFSENSADYGGAIYVSDCSAFFNQNTITNNSAVYDGDGIYSVADAIPSIQNNNILANGEGLFNASQSTLLHAPNNYWGSPSGAYHGVYNNTGEGDTTSQFTNPTPFLSAPDLVAPPIPLQNVVITDSGNDFISLRWESSPLPDLEAYRLHYGTDTAAYSYENSIDLTTLDTTYTLDGLALGTAYYIAVTCVDTAENESWYSLRATGVTRVVQAQGLDIAGDEELQHITTHNPLITFDYFDSMGETQTTYQIQIATDSTFQGGDIWDTGPVAGDATAIQYDQGLLANGQTYYLRAKVASGEFWSDWSTLTFRMNSEPTIPSLISPVENLVVDDPIQLTINASIDSENDQLVYQYFVFDDNSLEVLIDSSEWVSDINWQVIVQLADNNQFWWYARSYDGYEMSAITNAASFLVNTENNAPGYFTLTYPALDNEITTLQPNFTWTNSIDPDPVDTVSYTLLLETPDPGIETFDVGNSSSMLIAEPLADNTEYFWKVVATDLVGFETENTGGYTRFITNESNENPSVVDLYSPDSVMVLTLTPKMIWSAAVDADPGDMVSYEMHWWGDGIEYDSVLTDTHAVILPRELQDNTQYFWDVITMDSHDGISHSTPATFWTDLEPEAPAAFALLSPEHEATGLTNLPTFQWEVSVDPDPMDYATYTFQVATDSVFTDIAYETITNADVGHELTESLPGDTEYWWRVIATDTDALFTESEAFKFTVGYVSVAEIVELPTEFTLKQNFPNPFNPSTTIRYGLPEDSHVSLVIYDLLGNVVQTLESGTKSAGWYDLVWNGQTNDGRTISTGLYFARIVAGDYSQTIKMLYLK